MSNLYGTNLTSVGLAKISCDNDQSCIGILDQTCDYKSQGSFRLCHNGIKSSEMYATSCMFQKKDYKKDYFGMYFFQNIFMYFKLEYYRQQSC